MGASYWERMLEPVRLNLIVEGAFKRQLERLAQEEHMSLSAMVRTLLEDGYRQWGVDPSPKPTSEMFADVVAPTL